MNVGSFSWRSVLGWLFILFGGTLSVVMVLGAAVYLVSLNLTSFRPVSRGTWWMVFGGGVLQFAGGTLWFHCGRRILAKQTWLPIAGCLIGYVCGVLGAMLMHPHGI